MAIIVTRATTGLVSGTGTITTSTSSTSVTGVSTLFTTEIDYVGKALYTSGDVYIGTVATITNNTTLTLSANAAVAVSGGAYKIGYLPKNSPLSNAEIDTNFINLNNTKLEFTDTTAVNISNAVVRRDSSGNFAAGTITAALNGNAGTATTLQTSRNINGVAFNGSADILTPTIYDAAFTRIVNPGGGVWSHATPSITGALAITLPVGPTNTMISITIKVYEYTTNKSFELHVGGYPYTGNTWANAPFAYIIGNPSADRALNVRLGYTSAGKMVIYIGETSTTWAYPQVFVTEVLCGFGGLSSSYLSGWSISSVTAFENVTATIASTDTQVGYGVTTNTANSLVKRDASGNFSAGTITASLTGTASALVTGNNYQVNSLGIGTAASGTAGEIRATNAITSYYSDERLKQNIQLIPNALEKVLTLRGVTYEPNQVAESFGYKKEKLVGVLAQDVEKVLPEAVKPAPFDLIQLQEGIEISSSGQNYKTVQYEKLVPLLIESIKQLKIELDEIKGVK